MIDVEVEDGAWVAALPDAEDMVRKAIKAAFTHHPLIPAQAGTRGEPLTPRPKTWVPACAGMSGVYGMAALLTSDHVVQDLNARFRGRDQPTNVLSFPAPASAHPHLGDIALAYGVCAREAEAQGKSLAHHLMHLTVHGVLHLLGCDHETDAEASAMEGMERDILATLGVSDPYAHPGGGVEEANA